MRKSKTWPSPSSNQKDSAEKIIYSIDIVGINRNLSPLAGSLPVFIDLNGEKRISGCD
jgi:hypothetical protein